MQNAATTLNYLEVLTSPERTALLKEMIAEYEAQNPGIKINLISPPYEQADQKATLMLNTNQALDIIEIRDYTVKQFVNNRKLMDLTEHFKGWQDAKTLTAVAKTAARTVDNIPYLVPQCIFIKALFVRTDVLAANGIDYAPKTFSSWLKYLDRLLTHPRISMVCLGVNLRRSSLQIFLPQRMSGTWWVLNSSILKRRALHALAGR